MMKFLLLLITSFSCNSPIIKEELKDYKTPCILKEEVGNITYYAYACNRCRYTGNGSLYDHNGWTIAYYDPNENKRLYYGKYAIVTNLTTGQYCVVKITDSGMFREYPYIHKNIIFDATPAVFKHLGFTTKQGIGNNVRIQIYE